MEREREGDGMGWDGAADVKIGVGWVVLQVEAERVRLVNWDGCAGVR